MRSLAWWPLVALALMAPSVAVAGEVISLSDARVPLRTVADHTFEAHVSVANKGSTERTVYLFAALYAPGAMPCGASSDPRFRTFTPLVQARLELPAGAKLDYPPPGEAWPQRYHAKDVPAGDATMEWCVFAAEDADVGSAQLRYDDYVTLPLRTRDANHAPTADFTWSTGPLYAARDVEFHANGTDTDGDPLTFSWDFGRANAWGRPAPTPEADAFHAFYPDGTYVVTLTTSDGFDAVTVAHTLVVAPEPNSDTIGPPRSASRTPFVDPLMWVVVVAAAGLIRSHARRAR